MDFLGRKKKKSRVDEPWKGGEGKQQKPHKTNQPYCTDGIELICPSS